MNKEVDNDTVHHCDRETYFDGNTCRCCHFTFSDWELTHNTVMYQRVNPNEYLCDSCIFDWRTSCHTPNRPNITFCLEYKKR